MLTVVFAREQALGGMLPAPEAFEQLGALLQQGADGRRAVRDPGAGHRGHPADAGRRGAGHRARGGRARGDVPQRGPGRAAAARAVLGRRGALRRSGASWLWFLLAAAGYLLLLLAEGRDRLSQWGRVFGGRRAAAPGRPRRACSRARRRWPRSVPAGASGCWRSGSRWWSRRRCPRWTAGCSAGAASGNGSGRAAAGTISAVNPLVSLQNSLNQPEDREVLRYSTNAQDTQEMYLRIVALDEFDGASWKSSERQIKDVPDRLPTPDGLRAGRRHHRGQTSISAAGWYAQSWLPMPYPGDAGERSRATGGSSPTGRTLVGDRRQTTRGAQYTVASLLVQPTAAQLASAPRAPPAALLSEYTQVPDSLPAVVGATARQVTEGATNDYEKAVELQDWFSTGRRLHVQHPGAVGHRHRGDRQLPEGEGGLLRPLLLHDGRDGPHAGHPGPGRGGLHPGRPRSRTARCRSGLRDAHAWPELYFEGVGWTRFEPTPTPGQRPRLHPASRPRPDGPSSPAQPARQRRRPEPSAAPSAADCLPAAADAASGDCGPRGGRRRGAAPTDSGPSALGPDGRS